MSSDGLAVKTFPVRSRPDAQRAQDPGERSSARPGLPTACTTIGAGLAIYPRVALDAQHAWSGPKADTADPRSHRLDAVGSRGCHHDAVEIVVVVFFFLAMMARARLEVILFGAGGKTDQDLAARGRLAIARCGRRAAARLQAALRWLPARRVRPDRFSTAPPDRHRPIDPRTLPQWGRRDQARGPPRAVPRPRLRRR